MPSLFLTKFQMQFNERTAFSTQPARALGYPCIKTKQKNLNLSLISYTKNNSSWITDLSVKLKTFRKKKNRRKSLETRSWWKILIHDTKGMIHKRKD